MGEDPCTSCDTLPTADEYVVSAVTTVVSNLLQSAKVLTKNDCLYCSVLLSGILKSLVLQISCLAMVLSESQSLKVVGQILLQFLSAGIRRFSGGMAEMWPSTVL